MWIKSLLSDLAVSLAYKLLLYSRTKHMELDLYFVREKVFEQCPDLFTKARTLVQFSLLRSKLRVCDP